MEGKVQSRVTDFQEVWVITGPLFESTMPDLPNTTKSHTVPSGYIKIVYIEQDDGIRADAFIMNQDATSATDLDDFIVTIQTVENKSGLTFFPELTSPGTLKTTEDGDWVIQ